jgi:ribosome-binding protein aMBF1 (putative translation factor)
MTGDQCRAARELLGWSAAVLAAGGGSTATVVEAFEAGNCGARGYLMSDLRRALQAAGIEFIRDEDGVPGVRLRKDAQVAAVAVTAVEVAVVVGPDVPSAEAGAE